MTALILPANKRVVPAAAVDGLLNSTSPIYQTANPGGPAGSALMTFFCVFVLKRSPTTSVQMLFNRTSYGVTGWVMVIDSGNLKMGAGNNAGGIALTSTAISTTEFFGRPLIAICTFNSGTSSGWINGVAVTPVTLGTGYTAFSGRTAILNQGNSAVQHGSDVSVIAAGMLDAYDATGTFSTVNAQWEEDLQQGRYLTWPRTAVANSDWYWDARDVARPNVCGPTWTDRISSVAMTRTGSIQPAQAMPRF